MFLVVRDKDEVVVLILVSMAASWVIASVNFAALRCRSHSLQSIQEGNVFSKRGIEALLVGFKVSMKTIGLQARAVCDEALRGGNGGEWYPVEG